MSFLDAIILGIVEGITEFLPISSTGHLIITADLLSLEKSSFLSSFEISIQLGAILAVIFLYWKRFFLDHQTLKRVLLAFLPTALIGLAFYSIVKNYLLSSSSVVLWALLLGGAAIILFELFHKEKELASEELNSISYKQALGIGAFQAMAIIPGVSRAAASILGGLALGLKRKTIVEFSFLLAVPTMIAATGFDLYQNASSFNSSQFLVLAIGFIVSFLVAIVAIKFLLSFIQSHDFKIFGIYRIIIALVFFLII